MHLTLAAATFSPSEVTVLFLALAVLLGTARILGEIAQQFRQPAVLGEILAGVILGPTVLGAIAPDLMHTLFPTEGSVAVALQGLFVISAALLLLIAGVEVELSSVWRQGKTALLVSLTSVVIPFAIGFGGAWFMPRALGFNADAGGDMRLPFALFIGIALSITALPVIAKILMDLHLAKTDFGVLTMSAAMVNDLIGWLGFALVLAMIPMAGEDAAAAPPARNIFLTIALTLGFLALMLTAGKAIFHRTLPYLQVHWSWPGGVMGVILVVSLLSAAFTEWVGIHAIFGAFIAGVALGDSPRLRQQTRGSIHQFINNFFAPLFFASIGLSVNFVARFDWLVVIVVLVIAIVGKVLGAWLGAWWSGLSRKEGMALGYAMCARGAMEIILGKLALEAGLITEELFVALVVMALVTSLMSGPLIERALQRTKKRELKHLIKDRAFVPDMKATDARSAIRELSERAAELAGLPAEKIDAAVWAREQIVRTGLGHEVAIPHARLPDLAKPVLVIGRSDAGIDFDAPDGEAARFICLILTSVKEPETQIEVLELLSRKLLPARHRSAASEARNATELLAALTGDGDDPHH